MDKLFLSNVFEFWQLKANIKLNGRKRFDEMEQRNSEKNQKVFCVLTFNARADFITRYNLNN